jgi:hypothetical protein
MGTQEIHVLFRQSEPFVIHGFTFRPSPTDFQGQHRRCCHAEVGVDDALSKGYAIEIGPDGHYTVWNYETQLRVEVSAEPWSYGELIHLIEKYEGITGDVRKRP